MQQEDTETTNDRAPLSSTFRSNMTPADVPDYEGLPVSDHEADVSDMEHLDATCGNGTDESNSTDAEIRPADGRRKTKSVVVLAKRPLSLIHI